MHQSGITMSEEVFKTWNFARADPTVSFVKMNIQNDTFAVQKIGHGGQSTEDFFKAAAAELKPKEAAYIPVRSAPESDKFVLVYYMPNNARVHDKMIYAASLSSLKQSLGSDNLSGEMSIQLPEECTTQELALASHVHKKTDLFTMNEILAYEALYSSQQGLENESKVSVDLPISIAPAAAALMKQIKTGEAKGANFSLNPDTEVLEIAERGDTADELAKFYTNTSPRFTLVHHVFDGQPVVCFVYYCPEKAKAMLKMFYSASKSLLLKSLATFDITPRVSYECNEPKEVSTRAFEDILNPVVEEKKAISKPKAKGASSMKIGKFADF